MELKFKQSNHKNLPTIDEIIDNESESDQEFDKEKGEEYDQENGVKSDPESSTVTSPVGQVEFEYEFDRQSESNYLNPVIQFHIPFEGDLNLEFLKTQSKKGVLKELYFHTPGKIKSLKNLPDTLEILFCPDQELIDIDPLPRNLKTLHVPKNNLESLDLAKTPELKILNVSNNNLLSITHLPASLEEIRILNNPKLSEIKFEDYELLKVFEHDPNLIINNFDYVEFKQKHPEYTKKIEGGSKKSDKSSDSFRLADTPPEVKFENAIYKYFEYKKQYEQSERELKKKLRNEKLDKKQKKRRKPELPKCIKCKQSVGMTFKKDGLYYIAKCGLENKYNCDFHLEIKSPDVDDLMKEVQNIYQEFETSKNNLIKMKLDNLFGYETSDITTKKFEKEMSEYKILNQHLHLLLEKYNQLFGQIELSNEGMLKQYQMEELETSLREMTSEYKEMIDAYHEDPSNYSLLDNAMEFYVTKLRSVKIELMKLLYPTMEMNREPHKKEYQFVGDDTNSYPSKMYYSHVTPDFYTYEYEPGSVIKYIDKV